MTLPKSQQSILALKSWLFTPETKSDRFGRAADAYADSLIVDLEDAVAPSSKIEARETALGYPVLPVVQKLTEICKDDLAQWCHWGATTQDITDTATVLQIRSAFEFIELEMKAVSESLSRLARDHRNTPMIGRSNLQQA